MKTNYLVISTFVIVAFLKWVLPLAQLAVASAFIVGVLILSVLVVYFIFRRQNLGKANLKRIPVPAALDNGIVPLRGEAWPESYAWAAQYGYLDKYEEYVNKWAGITFPLFLFRYIRGRVGKSRGRWFTRQEWVWGEAGTVYLSNQRVFFKGNSFYLSIPYSDIKTYDRFKEGIIFATSVRNQTKYFKVRALGEDFQTAFVSQIKRLGA